MTEFLQLLVACYEAAARTGNGSSHNGKIIRVDGYCGLNLQRSDEHSSFRYQDDGVAHFAFGVLEFVAKVIRELTQNVFRRHKLVIAHHILQQFVTRTVCNERCNQDIRIE